jgi:hypothetical protein
MSLTSFPRLVQTRAVAQSWSRRAAALLRLELHGVECGEQLHHAYCETAATTLRVILCVSHSRAPVKQRTARRHAHWLHKSITADTSSPIRTNSRQAHVHDLFIEFAHRRGGQYGVDARIVDTLCGSLRTRGVIVLIVFAVIVVVRCMCLGTRRCQLVQTLRTDTTPSTHAQTLRRATHAAVRRVRWRATRRFALLSASSSCFVSRRRRTRVSVCSVCVHACTAINSSVSREQTLPHTHQLRE